MLSMPGILRGTQTFDCCGVEACCCHPELCPDQLLGLVLFTFPRAADVATEKLSSHAGELSECVLKSMAGSPAFKSHSVSSPKGFNAPAKHRKLAVSRRVISAHHTTWYNRAGRGFGSAQLEVASTKQVHVGDTTCTQQHHQSSGASFGC